jgi:molybdate transport system permease protein
MIPLSPTDYDAVRLSVQVAVAATLLALPFGFVAAYLITFVKFRGKVIMEVLVNLPLTLPPVVVGYFLLLLLGKHGWLGSLLSAAGIRVIFTLKAAVLASAVVGFPLLVRSLRVGMEGIDPQLINASRTLGARWYDTLGTVILPLSVPGLAAGSSLMFARSLGEFGATIIVAGNIPGVTQTIPLAIYEYASSPSSETMALSLCLVSVAISMVVLFLHEMMARKIAGRV